MEHESKSAVQKNSRAQPCAKKVTRIYALKFFCLYLLLPAGIENQIVENDVMKTQILEVTEMLYLAQEFLLA